MYDFDFIVIIKTEIRLCLVGYGKYLIYALCIRHLKSALNSNLSGFKALFML